MQKDLQIAIKAAIEGGAEIMKIYQKDFLVEIKEDNSPLTIADRNANDIINSFTNFDLVFVMTQGGPGHATDLLITYILIKTIVG